MDHLHKKQPYNKSIMDHLYKKQLYDKYIMDHLYKKQPYNKSIMDHLYKKQPYNKSIMDHLYVLTIHLAALRVPRRHLRKRKSWTIIVLFNFPLEFQPKMKNWIYHHSNGFLNYTSVLFKQRYIAGSAKCTKPLSKL